eukprot:CAMPEP_0172524132 /NCGR_PEP_ID=MMETSP1066-20121228/294026_1 /TAXON_ID=671091 /ORGANISM="Coscinodiscus wailesii, Strain CCMP2513" /LENGTH=53 /DNA_ID=CAMNT_0013307243 /DNA_START=836 /DNA_END=997 /DNA_ORIENTATION=-
MPPKVPTPVPVLQQTNQAVVNVPSTLPEVLPDTSDSLDAVKNINTPPQELPRP